MKLRSLYTILHEPDPEPKGGGKAGEAPPPDLAKIADDLIKKHGGDHGAAVRAILADRDGLAAQLAEARGKLPKDGHVVIDPDRARLLSDYEGLGLKPDQVKAALGERDELGKWKSGRERADHHARVAGLHGFKPSVYATLADRDGVEVVVVEDKDPKTQKPVEVAKVKGKDEKGVETLTALPDYAAKHWGDYLPALKPDSLRVVAPPLGSPPAANGPPRPPVVPSDQPRRSLVR